MDDETTNDEDEDEEQEGEENGTQTPQAAAAQAEAQRERQTITSTSHPSITIGRRDETRMRKSALLLQCGRAVLRCVSPSTSYV